MVNLRQAFKIHPDASGQLPPKETVNGRVIALGFFGAAAAIMYGYDLGFIGGVITLPAFLHDFDLTNAPKSYVTDFSSNVVSVFQAGAVFGALLSSPLANHLGRRWSIIINLIIYTIGAAFMTGAQGSAGVALMYTGRVFTGWAVGASSMITPVYVAECAPAHIRGRLVGLYEVGVQFGTMVGFWIPYGVLQSQKGTIQWRLPVALQLIPAVLCIIAMWFLKESPRFTAKKHGEAKALEDLAYIRGLPADHAYVRAEMAAITEQVAFERAQTESLDKFAVAKRLFGRQNIRRLYTGVLVMIFFQMAGTNAVNYYSPLIFQSFGLNSASAKLFATGVYGVVRFVSTLIAMVLFTDRFGRRTMLVYGGGAMAVFMWIIGALTHTFPPSTSASGPSSAQIAAIVMIFLWAVSFCFSYAGIPWIYCAEIFTLDTRVYGMAICTAVHWAFNLMIAKAVPYMIANLTPGGLFFIFAACTSVGSIWEYFCMPETKGRTLEEIEEAFSGRKGDRGMMGMVEDKNVIEHVEIGRKDVD